jgi:hypothetical protein
MMRTLEQKNLNHSIVPIIKFLRLHETTNKSGHPKSGNGVREKKSQHRKILYSESGNEMRASSTPKLSNGEPIQKVVCVPYRKLRLPQRDETRFINVIYAEFLTEGMDEPYGFNGNI